MNASVMTEKDICNTIVADLNRMGYWVWRVNTGGMNKEYKGKVYHVRFNLPGTSDILGMRKKDGKFIAIEVKKPGKKSTLTPAQESFLEMVKLNGGIAFCATSTQEAISSLNSFQ